LIRREAIGNITAMTELLEREGLLASLGAARAEGGRLVFVGGEAGVGKTALVRAFAAATRAPLLQGACENLTTPTPLGPIVDIAAQLGGAFAERAVHGAGPRDVARALLAELSDSTLVVIEDVHWADEATLDVLRVLGRRIDSVGAVVLATYRDDEAVGDHPLRLVLGELASSAAVRRLSVPRLSLDAVRALAAPRGADAEAIHRLTRGNAFYVTEILAAGADPGGGALPETVRDAVLARAASLGSEARSLLGVVALVPAGAELWLLEAVAGGELQHLEVCLQSGILREDGDAVAFRHELARLAVESSIPPHRRRALHARLLEALAEPAVGSPDPSRLAHHAEHTGDTAAVLEHAPLAARSAADAGAHREAASQYARALRYADGLPSAERASMLDAFAHEAQLTGRYSDAISARFEAVGLFRTIRDRLHEGRALSRLIIPLITVGRNADAEDASRAAIELLESLPASKELASAYAAQAYARMLNRDNADGVEWGKKAVALAEALGDRDTLTFGLNMIGASHVMAGDIERGIEYLLQTLDVARADCNELRIGSALGMLGSGLGEMYELERSERYLWEHIAFAEEHDLWPLYARSWLSLVQVYTGRWDIGSSTAQSVLAQAEDPISRISALIALGRVRARRGDPGAREVLDEALGLARPGGHLQRLGHVHAARAEAAWLAGDRDLAVVEARAAYPLAISKRHLWFVGELAYWQHKAGALIEWPDWIAEPYRLQLSGDAEAAAAVWSARRCPYEAARALADAADPRLLLAALAALERLGAGPAVRELRHKLRALGVSAPRGPRPSTRSNPAELTRREVEVLRLVAAGKRNADIASELVLSPRTVDHHVSAILRKLLVKTRGEAAAAARDLGLLDDPPATG
jgi:DNA-binding CsgD family transcriptional regulator